MEKFVSTDGEDGWDVDFNDTRGFVARRWQTVCKIYRSDLSAQDRVLIDQWRDFQSVGKNLREKYKTASTPSRELRFDEALQFLSTYRHFDRNFIKAMNRPDMETSLIFGALGLVIELCSESESRLAKVLEVLGKVKRQFELFNRCKVAYEEESDMANNMVLALEKFAGVLLDMVKYMQEHPRRVHVGHTSSVSVDPNETTDSTQWPPFRRDKIEPAIEAMGDCVTQIHSIAAFTTLRRDRQTSYVAQKLEGTLNMQEYSRFPCISVPLLRNEKFYGREQVLKEIAKHLDWKLNPEQKTTRTFTIYGRRGIGKTHIALEYVYRNEKTFDAIFWIQCETAASLRKSFTDMALSLRLPKAVQGGPHEDNLILCHDWLRKTDKRWLLIYDNAENINLLEPYWPAASGGILITSRSWVNFAFDTLRKGVTVNPFNKVERWEVLCKLVGWDKTNNEDHVSTEDLDAIETLLGEDAGFGLGLSISLTASLIQAREFRNQAIGDLLKDFETHSQRVPIRSPKYSTLNTSHTVDTLYNIAFAVLSENARTLLNILCLLSPDVTQEGIFNPKNQEVLTPMLEFCKQETRKLATLSPQLHETIKELKYAGLIKREGRVLSVHRVVQEAFFYLHVEQRQSAFDAAVRLIDEAFPRQIHGRLMHNKWERCEANIQDVLFLTAKYEDFRKAGQPVAAPPEFGELLKNAAWYLFEVGEHRESKQLLRTAFRVCGNEDSLLYAHLRNTAAVVDFELNHLPRCRASLEKALEVRRQLLHPHHEELANTIHNMGNLSSAEGDPERALEYFEEAEDIRSRLGEDSAIPLAITNQGMGRAYFLQHKYDEALERYEKAELLAEQYAGKNSVVLAGICYSIGNLMQVKGNPQEAKRRYDQALNVFIIWTPMHILTSCTFYKLGCCEGSMGNLEHAKRNLEKAFEIGNFRRTGLDDGNIARILWRQATIDPTQELEDKLDQAQLMRTAVEKNTGARIGREEPDEVSYDKLVCGYFR